MAEVLQSFILIENYKQRNGILEENLDGLLLTYVNLESNLPGFQEANVAGLVVSSTTLVVCVAALVVCVAALVVSGAALVV